MTRSDRWPAACRARIVSCTVLALTALLSLQSHALAARKAFVVGNSTYQHAAHLPNPANDARALAQSLQSLGYQVTLAVDVSRTDFLGRFQAYARSLQQDDVALIFFAGHGLQIGGENYLFPVDAKVERETDARGRLVALNALLADLSRASRSRVVILDACRNNPFEDEIAKAQATRSAAVTRGLARVYAGVGTFVAYSTQPGNVALDGDGQNSPFTAALLRHMREPGADVHAVMRRVRGDVQRATSDQQIPWENSSLVDELAFNAAGVNVAPSSAVSPAGPATAVPPSPTAPPPARPSPVVESFSFVTGLDPKGDNFLALRTSPTGDGSRIATMGPDTLLKVVESRGSWRRVVLLDGTSGWAHGNWIACCRNVALARPTGAPQVQPIRPVPAPATHSAAGCNDLWTRRNAIWHRHGYCFTTARGQQAFGNRGCSRDQNAARAAMSPAERAEVEALLAQERQAGCQ